MGMGSRLCGNDGVRQGMVEPQRALRAQRGRDREGAHGAGWREHDPCLCENDRKCGAGWFSRIRVPPCHILSLSALALGYTR